MRELRGQCLCGATRLRVQTAVRVAHECHCTQCRRWSGHIWAYLTVRRAALTVEGPVAWYRHSAKAQRGFCADCGSSLFWAKDGSASIDISAGALEAPTGLCLGAPSFPADHGDYYEVSR